jgi:hypothetical protein
MKVICLLTGCKWGAPVRFKSYGELLVQHKCTRCGSVKTEVGRG